MSGESLPLNHVRVGDRHRKDFGDLDALAASIKAVGLLGPIVVDADNNLVAGHRRLEACRKLGWPNVPVRRVRQITDAITALKAERDENTCRKDFTPSEAVALGLALEEMERPKAEERRANLAGRNPDGTPRVSERANGHDRNARTRDVVAPAVGLKPRTYDRAKAVVLAQDDPDPKVSSAAKEAVAEMDATGNVSAAERKVKAARGQLTTNDKIAAAAEAHPNGNGSGKSRAEVEVKVATAKRMAAEGYTSKQIATAIGISEGGMYAFRERHGVEVPADAIVGRRRTVSAARVIEEAAISLEGIVLSLTLLGEDDLAQIDAARSEQWATSFTNSLRSLNRFHKHLKEMALVHEQ